MYRFISTIILTILLINISFAQPKKKKTKKAKPIQNQQVVNQDSPDSFQVLASGKSTKFDKPFIFAVRDKETYKLLQNLVEKLPMNMDFSQNAVVAFFAQLPNPCHTFSVNKNSDDKITVNFISPQMRVACRETINSAFKVVLIPLDEEKSLWIEMNESWQNAIKSYKISNSKFDLSGGFAGISEDFEVLGNIQVMTFGDYATFVFDLTAKGENNNKTMKEISSGTLKKGDIKLSKLFGGNIADNPKAPMKVTGKLDKKLSLFFDPLPTNVSDGFSVSGNLEANF